MYSLIRPVLFKLDAERAHNLTLNALDYVPGICFPKPKGRPVQALGLDFPHPVGLAAGLDKNAEHLDALAKVGFSSIEVGTVTPFAQKGNPKPRLFRMPKAQAVINRMGFNNHGVDELIRNIQRSRYKGILGINIGKNKDTPIDKAVDDYLTCLKKVYAYASYVTINISSPNTPDLRQLHQDDFFSDLISALYDEQRRQADIHQRHVPLVVKVSPDESADDMKRVAKACDQGLVSRKDAASVILYTSEKATQMALQAIQILGGNGYINEYPTGRLLRDAKLYEIGAGTSEIRRMLIGRELFKQTST